MTQFGTGQATVQTGSREVGIASSFRGGLLPSERFPKEESERFHIRGTRSYVERATSPIGRELPRPQGVIPEGSERPRSNGAKETCFRNTETGGAPAS